ncbi:DUF4244 domain-containing protein [Brachybacterium sp. AOP25-B2-12]|uniref:DUF4244 domain-containing protein n=1 Tax=Brachybacterium sp. AOP25-B2-12 TaxID=3457710 RepID=UPI004034B84F
MTTTITTRSAHSPRGRLIGRAGTLSSPRSGAAVAVAATPRTLAGSGGRPPRSPVRAGRAAADRPGDPDERTGAGPADGPKGTTDRSLGASLADDAGATTAEYAITTLAACGFAAVLVVLLKSGEVRALLLGIITSALSLGS